MPDELRLEIMIKNIENSIIDSSNTILKSTSLSKKISDFIHQS
jgi:hypothetical protein